MKIEKDKIYSILTGDIVGSTKLLGSARQNLHRTLTTTSDLLIEHFRDDVPYRAEIFRGDSWQFMVSNPSKSLRIGLFYRALIRAGMQARRIDTRISMGIGTIDFLPGDQVSSGDGQAYQLSGDALETLHRPNRMVVSFPQHLISDLTITLDAVVKLIDVQARNWTEKQARAVSGAMLDLTQEGIAKNWFEKEISQQAVAQHLDRSGWSSVELGITSFEQVVENIIA